LQFGAKQGGLFRRLIAGFDQVTSTAMRVLPTYRDLPNTRVFAQGSVSYFTTQHDIKAGYQFDYAWNECCTLDLRHARGLPQRRQTR
jgi:hypothetical protein